MLDSKYAYLLDVFKVPDPLRAASKDAVLALAQPSFFKSSKGQKPISQIEYPVDLNFPTQDTEFTSLLRQLQGGFDMYFFS